MSRVLLRFVFTLALTASQLGWAQDIVDATGFSQPPPPPPLPSDRRIQRVTLADGQVIRGYLVARTDKEITLELVTGGQISIPAAQVTAVAGDEGTVVNPDGELWFEDPHRTRYFYGPSGFMLRRGQGHFSQKELLFSTVSYGVLDNLSLQVGTIAPAWFLGPQGFNGILAVKAGGQIVNGLHLCGGAQALLLPFVGGSSGAAVAGLAFGCATVGTPDAHVTVAGGAPFLAQGYGRQPLTGFITSLSGNLRVGRNLALVTENWLVLPDLSRVDPEAIGIDAFGVRFMGEQIAVDLGAMWFWTTRYGVLTAVPIPWLDFTFNFNL